MAYRMVVLGRSVAADSVEDVIALIEGMDRLERGMPSSAPVAPAGPAPTPKRLRKVSVVSKRRPALSAAIVVEEELRKGLSTGKAIAAAVGASRYQALSVLQRLADEGRVTRTGAGAGTQWSLAEPKRKKAPAGFQGKKDPEGFETVWDGTAGTKPKAASV